MTPIEQAIIDSLKELSVHDFADIFVNSTTSSELSELFNVPKDQINEIIINEGFRRLSGGN